MAVKNSGSDLSLIVKQTRKLAGLTQAQLADLAGVGKTLVFNLEKGHEKIALNNLRKILNVLNIQIIFNAPIPNLEAREIRPKKVNK